jgi:hypothetical protein
MIHRVVNGFLELLGGNVPRLMSELIEGAFQTFRTRTTLLSSWSGMGIERHNAHFFVIT